ncbi:MAG: hypothetical protein JNL38_27625 [Myxococcales bacterium]|jgi:hypothetical protein|nr:hypothetical protein [Myxococcales bacterium]
MQGRAVASSLGLCVCVSWLLAGCAADTGEAPSEAVGEARAAARPDRSFTVDFSGCSEMASLTPVPVANVRDKVPAGYALANEAAGTTFIVVRIAHCSGMAIDGEADGAGTVAQVGVNLVSPDGTGDINNYTLWYYTTSRALFQKLKRVGIDEAQWTPGIDYRYTASGPGAPRLDITVPGNPAFTVGGPVTATGGPVPFTANWWGDRGDERVRMNTTLPAIGFGGATMSLTTSPRSKLGRVLGSGAATFPIFDSYNEFAGAHMVVEQR